MTLHKVDQSNSQLLKNLIAKEKANSSYKKYYVNLTSELGEDGLLVTSNNIGTNSGSYIFFRNLLGKYHGKLTAFPVYHEGTFCGFKISEVDTEQIQQTVNRVELVPVNHNHHNNHATRNPSHSGSDRVLTTNSRNHHSSPSSHFSHRNRHTQRGPKLTPITRNSAKQISEDALDRALMLKFAESNIDLNGNASLHLHTGRFTSKKQVLVNEMTKWITSHIQYYPEGKRESMVNALATQIKDNIFKNTDIMATGLVHSDVSSKALKNLKDAMSTLREEMPPSRSAWQR